MEESKVYLTEQIITYIGNKRALLSPIEEEVKTIRAKIGRQKLRCADLFSGSGIVSRMLKQYSETLIANDRENYSFIINDCYLSNKSSYPQAKCDFLREKIIELCRNERRPGIIAEHYAPQDDNSIRAGERVFYTHENAVLIDTYRALIDKWVTEEGLKKFFLAPLITEASIHVNTSGVFKGFYKDKRTGIGCFGASGKNALTRARKLAIMLSVLIMTIAVYLICFAGRSQSFIPAMTTQKAMVRVLSGLTFEYQSDIKTKAARDKAADRVPPSYDVIKFSDGAYQANLLKLIEMLNARQAPKPSISPDSDYEMLNFSHTPHGDDISTITNEEFLERIKRNTGFNINAADLPYILSDTNPDTRQKIFWLILTPLK